MREKHRKCVAACLPLTLLGLAGCVGEARMVDNTPRSSVAILRLTPPSKLNPPPPGAEENGTSDEIYPGTAGAAPAPAAATGRAQARSAASAKTPGLLSKSERDALFSSFQAWEARQQQDQQ